VVVRENALVILDEARRRARKKCVSFLEMNAKKERGAFYQVVRYGGSSYITHAIRQRSRRLNDVVPTSGTVLY